MREDVSVFIGIPSGSDWKADFGMSLAGLVAYAPTYVSGVPHVTQLRLWNAKGSILPRGRTTLARKALEFGATHLLFLDSDMTFPPDTLHRLLRHCKSVIACNCATKMLPSTPTARDKSNTTAGKPVYTLEASTGVRKIWRVGTGVMLIDMRVFRTLPEPWFPIDWDDTLKDYRGEDWAFAAKCEEAGIPFWIEEGLSKEIGHVGDFRYEHKHVEVSNPTV